jgi:hypothetical protein
MNIKAKLEIWDIEKKKREKIKIWLIEPSSEVMKNYGVALTTPKYIVFFE